MELLPSFDAKLALQQEAPGAVAHPGVRCVQALSPAPHPVMVGPAECELHADGALDRRQDGSVFAVIRAERYLPAQPLNQPYVGHLGIKRHWHARPHLGRVTADTQIGPSGGYPAGKKKDQPNDQAQPDSDETGRGQAGAGHAHGEPAAYAPGSSGPDVITVTAMAGPHALQARAAAFAAEQFLRPRRGPQDVFGAAGPPAMVAQRGNLRRAALVAADHRCPLIDLDLHVIAPPGQRPAGRRSNRSRSACRSAFISRTTGLLSARKEP